MQTVNSTHHFKNEKIQQFYIQLISVWSTLVLSQQTRAGEGLPAGQAGRDLAGEGHLLLGVDHEVPGLAERVLLRGEAQVLV